MGREAGLQARGPNGWQLLTPEEWKKIKAAAAGTVWNRGRQCMFKGTREFWAPLGQAEEIIAYKEQKPNLKIPRKELLSWIQQSVKTEDNQLTNEAYFQVLKVDVGDDCGYFWRPNQGADWFEQQMDPNYHARREAEKKNREAVRYAKPKYQAGRQQSGSSNEWPEDAWQHYQSQSKGYGSQSPGWSESWSYGGYKK